VLAYAATGAVGRDHPPRPHLDAAVRSLLDQGYVGTTIAAIAQAADIPAQTIYSAYGGKAAILQAIAWGVAGTLDVDRAHEEALAQPDPRAGLRLAAGIQRRQFEQMYDVNSWRRPSPLGRLSTNAIAANKGVDENSGRRSSWMATPHQSFLRRGLNRHVVAAELRDRPTVGGVWHCHTRRGGETACPRWRAQS